jgi:acetate kinase
MLVLVLNAGSSTLKAAVLEGDRRLARVTRDRGGAGDAATLAGSLADLADAAGVAVTAVDAVAHRVVHGGERFVEPTVLDPTAIEAIEALAELAPLHNGPAVEVIRAARDAIPAVPHVACFDTAFHATLPATARRDPLPDGWVEDWGIRRFGFHGLAVEWVAGRAAELLGRPADELELVVAHLGGGCSVTAVAGGRSAWTSMGFTPLDGLMMGSRPGSLDPGVLLHVLRRGLLDVDGLATSLERGSGLVGVGGTGDVAALEAAADGGDVRARLALDLFVDRAAAGIAAAATRLRRLDAVAFSGGIGEHAGRVRAAIVERLAVLGVRPIDGAESGADRIVRPRDAGLAGSAGPPVLRIEAREDVVLARAAAALVERGRTDG